MLEMEMTFSLHVVKVVVTLVALVSYLYFYKEWKKVKHSTSLFSFYTTAKVLKQARFIVTGLMLLLISFIFEFFPGLYVPIVNLLQILGIVSIGYVLYMLFRSGAPKPAKLSEVESIEYHSQKQKKPSAYETFKTLKSKKQNNKTLKKTKKLSYHEFLSKYRSKGWTMKKIGKEWKKYKKR